MDSPPHFPPPANAHDGGPGLAHLRGIRGGLGPWQGRCIRGAGGAGHSVGFLSNWKPGDRQSLVHRLRGTEPAMTARPRQAGTFRNSDSLSHRSGRAVQVLAPGEQVAVEQILDELQRTSQFFPFLIRSHRQELAYLCVRKLYSGGVFVLFLAFLPSPSSPAFPA